MESDGVTVTAQQPRAWTMAKVEAGARQRADGAEGQLVATFDVFHEVFGRADRESRSFTELLAAAAPVDGFDTVITSLASEANLADIEELVDSWRILAHGSARSFVDGNHEAGMNARHMAADLVVRHRAPLRAFAIETGLDSANQQDFDSMEWD